MSLTFTGFSEEDLNRIKLEGNSSNVSHSDTGVNKTFIRKQDKLGVKHKKIKYKFPIQKDQFPDDVIDSEVFDKCKLSLKSPGSPVDLSQNFAVIENKTSNENGNDSKDESVIKEVQNNITIDNINAITYDLQHIRASDNNYRRAEDDGNGNKLEQLQLKQKLMEEQNKKRKEMLAKALADRTKQTEEEVMRLEKIKKELNVLDGQFSQDVAVLRKKIDLACVSYSEAEKYYFKVEKEFLHAKISLQKAKEKKELLTEHLCALITHNETRKAQKLETLMLQLASDKNSELNDMMGKIDDKISDEPVIVDGVDERNGKIVEMGSPGNH